MNEEISRFEIVKKFHKSFGIFQDHFDIFHETIFIVKWLKLSKTSLKNIYYFLPTSAKLQALAILLRKVCLQRRLIGIKGVEEGDLISPMEGYWQNDNWLNRKMDSVGSPVINGLSADFLNYLRTSCRFSISMKFNVSAVLSALLCSATNGGKLSPASVA